MLWLPSDLRDGGVALAALFSAAVPVGVSPSHTRQLPAAAIVVQRPPSRAAVWWTGPHPSPPDTGSFSSTGDASSRRGTASYRITRDQLERERTAEFSSVLTAHIPGLRIEHDGPVDRVVSPIHSSFVADPCYVQVYMDGVFMPDGDVGFVRVDDLEQVEYDTPGRIPVQFQNDRPYASCGVLLLWRRGGEFSDGNVAGNARARSRDRRGVPPHREVT